MSDTECLTLLLLLLVEVGGGRDDKIMSSRSSLIADSRQLQAAISLPCFCPQKSGVLGRVRENTLYLFNCVLRGDGRGEVEVEVSQLMHCKIDEHFSTTKYPGPPPSLATSASWLMGDWEETP